VVDLKMILADFWTQNATFLRNVATTKPHLI